MAAEAILSPSTAAAQYKATPPTYADGDISILQTDSAGNLKVALSGTPSGTVTVKTAAQTTSPYTQASISTASSGQNTLVAGVASQTVRVYRIVWTLAAGTLQFRDGASTTLTGAMSSLSGVLEDPLGNPLFITTAGNAFTVNLSGANQLSGAIWYTQS